jgi:hypothetical protein
MALELFLFIMALSAAVSLGVIAAFGDLAN